MEMTQKEWDNLTEEIQEEAFNPSSPWFYIRLDEVKYNGGQ